MGMVHRVKDRMCPPDSVVGVIVTYNPDIGALYCVFKALLPQVSSLVIVDNGSKNTVSLNQFASISKNIGLVRLGTNLGIAAAQNLGIRWAREQGAAYVLLCDQDSVPAAGMVAELLAIARKLVAAGVSLALVAPRYEDSRQAVKTPFMHMINGRPRWFGCRRSDAWLEITTAIASGALIPMSTLASVGGMRDAFFIDLVDIEWCFRARSKGFQAFGVCGARLRHRLGEQPVRILGRTLATHCPARNYYFYRNAVWLFRQGYVPASWKWTLARQMLKRLLVFSTFVHPRLTYLKMMLLGLWHGLINREGCL